MKLLSYFGLDLIYDLQKKRKNQLLKQIEQDEILNNLKNDCPQEVCKFFILQRLLNRLFMKQCNDSNILSVISITENTLDIIENDIGTFDKLIDKKNDNKINCKNLKDYNNHLLNITKEYD